MGKGQAFLSITKPAGIALASLGQREVCQAGVLARNGPGRLTMSGEVNKWKFLIVAAHLLVLLDEGTSPAIVSPA